MGRLSSEKQPSNADADNAELERGLISDVSEVDADRIAVTITTEGSPYLGETATCSRLAVRILIERMNTGLSFKVGPRLRDCCRQGQAEVAGNSRN